MTARKALWVLVLVTGLVAAGWLAAPRPSDGLPLSPDSTAGDGTRALTEILERLGADVVVTTEPPDEATAGLLMVDNVGDEARAAWESIAERGGTLLVTDPGSVLAPELVGETTFGFVDPPIGRACDVDTLAGVSRVDTGGGFTLAAPDDGVGCFPRGEGHWLVLTSFGEGVVAATGGPGFLTNDVVGAADNAVLLAALLAPEPGAVVAVAPPQLAAAGDTPGLGDLVPDGAWIVMAQLLVAFVVVVLWRARRVGGPVVESSAVSLPGSELVIGVGGLYERGGAAAHAARLLRDDAIRIVAVRLRLGPGVTPSDAAEHAVAAGVPRRLAEVALTDPLPEDDRGLVALAGTVERLRTALDHIDTIDHEGAVRV